MSTPKKSGYVVKEPPAPAAAPAPQPPAAPGLPPVVVTPVDPALAQKVDKACEGLDCLRRDLTASNQATTDALGALKGALDDLKKQPAPAATASEAPRPTPARVRVPVLDDSQLDGYRPPRRSVDHDDHSQTPAQYERSIEMRLACEEHGEDAAECLRAVVRRHWDRLFPGEALAKAEPKLVAKAPEQPAPAAAPVPPTPAPEPAKPAPVAPAAPQGGADGAPKSPEAGQAQPADRPRGTLLSGI